MSKFVVRNISPLNKAVTIFGLSVYPNLTADLMKLPSINENAIKDSLERGELRTKLINGDLSVVESTVLLPSGDALLTQFLNSVGLGLTIAPNHAKSYLNQPEWYIDPVAGNDNRDGSTANSALKTFAEWHKRVGTFTTLDPSGGILTINVLNDLPDNDPIVFRNYFKAGTTGFVKGQRKVLATGTLSAVIDKSPKDNIPWQIVNGAASDGYYWEEFVGKMVLITSGAGAGSCGYIMRDMPGGIKTAHISEWFTDVTFIDAGTYPSENIPQAGDTFEVLDFTTAVMGNCTLGYNPESAPANDFGIPVGGIVTQNFRFPPASFATGFPTVLGVPDTVTGFSQCIFDNWLVLGAGGINNTLGNCLVRAGVSVNWGSRLIMVGGGSLAYPGSGFPAIEVSPGAEFNGAGDITFCGKNDEEEFRVAEIRGGGMIKFASASFWNAHHGPFPIVGGSLWMEPFDQWFGYAPEVPLWGNAVTSRMVVMANSMISIQQFRFGESTPILPSMTFNNDDGYNAVVGFGATDFSFMGSDNGLAHAFDPVTATYTTKRAVSWANLDTLIASGGFARKATTVFDDGGTEYKTVGTAVDPNTNGVFTWTFVGYIPAP